MNNEPVAWMEIDEVLEHFKSVGCGTVYKTAGEGRVPLYTHPAKTLTDEEIEKVFYELAVGHSAIDFARAILRKAQE